ncbi:hypothetical protein DIPPA_11634 [Diplonema papillatum]|nr:hypothetical protein DIPPA_11634 [Diplonema papillatum]
MPSKMASKNPSVLVKEAQCRRNREMKVTMTCPVWACSFVNGLPRLVLGGGSPQGFGHGQPLAQLDIDLNQRAKAEVKNAYKYTESPVYAMSKTADFGNAHIAVISTKPMTFVRFNGDLSWESLCSYSGHVDESVRDHAIRRIVISKSGRLAVVNSDSNSLHIVALETDAQSPAGYRARPAAILQGHSKDVMSIDMAPLQAPDGVVYDTTKPTPMLVASVSTDSTLRLWKTGDYPKNPKGDWVSQVSAATACAGIITLLQPPHYPHNDDPQKRFRLQVVRFSDNGTELHVVMARGDGPSFLVTYGIRWKLLKTPSGSRYTLACSTLSYAELSRTDAVTGFEVTPCNQYFVFTACEYRSLGVITRAGDIVFNRMEMHDGPINNIAIHQLGKDKILVATSDLSSLDLKIQVLHLTPGMSPLDVLKVVMGLLVILAGLAYVVLMSAGEGDLVSCLQNKLLADTSVYWTDRPAVLPNGSAFSLTNDIPKSLSQMMSNKMLMNMSFEDSTIIAALVGAPVAAALFAGLAGCIDWMLYVWVSFAAGAYLGDGILRLMPLGDRAFAEALLGSSDSAGQSCGLWLLHLLIMFVADAMTRSPPRDPTLDQNVFYIKRNSGDRLGLNTRQDTNEIAIVVSNSVAHRAGLREGMRIIEVNGKDVPEGEALDVLRNIDGNLKIQVVRPLSGGSSNPLPIDAAWAPCVAVSMLQHLVLCLFCVTHSTQYAVLLSMHSILYELAGMSTLYCCNVSFLPAIFLRVISAWPWLLVVSKVITLDTAPLLAAWVVPLSSAASVYVAVAHLLPALSKSTKFGLFGALLQIPFLLLGVVAHSLVV